MANGAAFPQRRVLENEGPRLFAVTLAAGFVQPGHGESACRSVNVRSMGVMALRTVHFIFRERVVLWQLKLRLRGAMAFEAGGRILSRVDNELATSATGGDVQARRPMARFAASLAGGTRILEANTGV